MFFLKSTGHRTLSLQYLRNSKTLAFQMKLHPPPFLQRRGIVTINDHQSINF